MNYFPFFIQFLITLHFVYCRENDSLTFVAKHREMIISEILHFEFIKLYFSKKKKKEKKFIVAE